MEDDGSQHNLPRIAITFCTQCRWMLRATYFAQELFSTFGNTIGEIALIPATGGLFQVNLTYRKTSITSEQPDELQEVLLWDRKTEGGFPETKVLKQKVRNYIDPEKSLGHSDKPGKNAAVTAEAPVATESSIGDCTTCVDAESTSGQA